MRILLIDQDKSANQALTFFLKNKGVVVDSAFSGEEGTELIRLYDFDLILIEFFLPDISGHEVLKKIRLSGIKTPIMMLSGSITTAQKISCFNAGADDYVVRPYDKNELFARIQAIIRRSRGYADSIVHVGQMEVNLDTKIVTVDGKVLHLTGKEYALIELLCLRQGMTVSKEQFLNHLYGGMDEPEMKIIDVFLCRIRNKIKRLSHGTEYIQTVWGRGYILKESK